MSRRDKVRQAVSLWKALQDRRWRGSEAGGQAQLQYRYEGIDHLVRRFESDDAGWRAYFSRHGIAPLEIGYEADLMSDPESTVRVALDWIGVSAPPQWRLDAPMQRQAGARSEEWVRAYHHDHAQRGPATADRSAASSL